MLIDAGMHLVFTCRPEMRDRDSFEGRRVAQTIETGNRSPLRRVRDLDRKNPKSRQSDEIHSGCCSCMVALRKDSVRTALLLGVLASKVGFCL